jgi:ABC-2 type transport system ATP-binding protein
VLDAQRLGKRYGEKRVLRGIDLALPRGGFLVVTGPNGSGKTTLLRICAGLAQPTEGTIERRAPRAQVGYLGHEPLVYRELTALENLDLYGRLYRVAERRERIGMLLERFDLWEARHERVAAFSRGMTQRLALCRVLLHEPELLVLDEPLNGLDPLVRAETIALFRAWGSEGKHVIISSHVLQEVDLISDQVVLIANGMIVAEGTIRTVREEIQEHPSQYFIRCRDASDVASRLFSEDHVTEIRLNDDRMGLLVMTRDREQFARALGRIALDGHRIERVVPADENVDALYEYLIGGE